MLASLVHAVPERVYRSVGVAFYGALVGYRVSLLFRMGAHASALDVALWGAETAIFCLIAIGYARRSPAVALPATAAEIVLPAIGGPLPLAMTLGDVTVRGLPGEWNLLIVMLVGNLVAASGYLYLGGSYGLFVAARPLRTKGPYAMIRHPIYLGQMIATLAVVALRWSPRNLAIWALFVAVQATRATLEERKLAACWPAYAEYRLKTWRFLPLVVCPAERRSARKRASLTTTHYQDWRAKVAGGENPSPPGVFSLPSPSRKLPRIAVADKRPSHCLLTISLVLFCAHAWEPPARALAWGPRWAAAPVAIGAHH